SGFPDASRLICGRNLSASNWSRLTAEEVSVVDPLRTTTTLSGDPVSLIAELSPATIAITITNTATTSAIPPAVIAVDTRLTSRLRRLYLSGIAILRHHPERIDDVLAGRGAGGKPRAEQSD